jgi:hypothetical protein
MVSDYARPFGHLQPLECCLVNAERPGKVDDGLAGVHALQSFPLLMGGQLERTRTARPHGHLIDRLARSIGDLQDIVRAVRARSAIRGPVEHR